MAKRCYYSVSGGFVVSEAVADDGSRQKQIAPDFAMLTLPFHAASELLKLTENCGYSIAEVMRFNERHSGAVMPRSTPACCTFGR